ncbi:hypothetical protein NQZ79_g1612 [Umbelopsis isabellina]|nr:hypothetical protein NQZ79_g1612 [Umbelopsis isabellina]
MSPRSSYPPPVRIFLDSLPSAYEDPGSRTRVSTINDTTVRWPKSQATRFIAAIPMREPNYLVMGKDEQVGLLQRAVDYFVCQKQEEQAAKAIQDDRFKIRDSEARNTRYHRSFGRICPPAFSPH